MSAIRPTDLEGFFAEALGSMGVCAVQRNGVRVLRDAAESSFNVVLTLPSKHVRVSFDEEILVSGTSEQQARIMLDALQAGARDLFRAMIEHIAKHDRSPWDRMEQVESAAAALLEEIGVSIGNIGMPYGLASKLSDKAFVLRELLRMKPGSPAWGKSGYGVVHPKDGT